MKIGIVTCWQPDDNYGTQIQCFALQMYLRLLGHDAYLIRYKRFEDMVKPKMTFSRILKVFNPYIVLRHIYYMLLDKNRVKNMDLNDRKSPEFREKYLNMTDIFDSYQDLKDNPPQADLYIVGSDQVWNITYEQNNNIGAHFLAFGKESTKRISYAASFGFSLEKLDIKYAKKIFPLLKAFAGISLRERSGIDICNTIAKINNDELKSIQVCDPTMLLSAEQYLNLFNSENVDISEEPYVFVYNIIAPSELDIVKISEWASENNLKVVYTMGHGRSSKIDHIYPTVPQWVKLIANAKYVITNSFHGTVFSLLFHKNCAVYPINIATSTNGRLETLVNLAEQNFVVEKGNSFVDKLNITIDWNIFEKNKSVLRNQGIDYLNEFLL